MTDTDRLLNRAMLRLADAGALFLGQGVRFPGHAMYASLEGIPDSQRIEFPVAEELQTGAATGLALAGFLPVSIYPRMDFLLRAADQLVNHLDKMNHMSRGQFKPRVILRTRVGARKPLDAGPQHTQDHTAALRLMLSNVSVIKLKDPADALRIYSEILDMSGSYLVVEDLPC